MVIDMHAAGVEVRPLQMPTGNSDFNEVFFDDVFVPDDDVVGPVDGWLDGGPGDARQRERQHRRRRSGRSMPAGRSSPRSTPTRSGWRAGPGGSAGYISHAGHGGAQPCAALPGRGRWRSRA